MSVLDIDTAGLYRPRTKETREAYEAMLSIIQVRGGRGRVCLCLCCCCCQLLQPRLSGSGFDRVAMTPALALCVGMPVAAAAAAGFTAAAAGFTAAAAGLMRNTFMRHMNSVRRPLVSTKCRASLATSLRMCCAARPTRCWRR